MPASVTPLFSRKSLLLILQRSIAIYNCFAFFEHIEIYFKFYPAMEKRIKNKLLS